jgi:hypothetical protein
MFGDLETNGNLKDRKCNFWNETFSNWAYQQIKDIERNDQIEDRSLEIIQSEEQGRK